MIATRFTSAGYGTLHLFYHTSFILKPIYIEPSRFSVVASRANLEQGNLHTSWKCHLHSRYPFPDPRSLSPKAHSVSTNSALVLAITYTYAQENRGRKVTLYFITIPIEWLPYALIFLTFVMDGPLSALQQGSGLVAAHLYDFLTKIYPAFGTKGGRSYIRTPAFVRRWFAGLGGRPTGPITRRYGTAYTAQSRTGQEQPGSQPSRGFATGFSGLWNSRGPGRRVGE